MRFHLTIACLSLLLQGQLVFAEDSLENFNDSSVGDSIMVRAEQLEFLENTPGTTTVQSPEPESFLQWDHLTGNWWGARKALAEKGIELEPNIIIDWSRDIHGGRSPDGTAFRHLFTLPLKVDLEKFIDLPGGLFFISFINQNGEPGSNDVGDFQGVGAWDANGRTQLSELWYQQKLAEDLIRIKAGKIDVNTDFAYLDQAGDFINGSVGWHLSCPVFPTYPDPAFGALVFVYPTPWLFMGTGIFDGSLREGTPTGERGPAKLFGKPSDLFAIGEAGAKWHNGQEKLASRLYFGGWGHTGQFTRFDGSYEHGTTGFYMGLDQELCRKNPDAENDCRGIAGFIQYDKAQGSVLPVDHHLAGGLVWTGPIPTRESDKLGASAAWAHFTHQPGAGFTKDGELNLELFYKLYLTPALSVMPDLQYIFNPGGQNLSDALVGTLQVQIVF